MRDRYSFKFNDLEAKNSHGCCASTLTWRDHAYSMHRLETGWWAATHIYMENGAIRVELITPPGGFKSGHRAYQTARDHLNGVQARLLSAV
jgi:hypothetical protein